jgi:hypothetical protein
MKKKLEDYLHLYIDCKIVGTYNDGSGSEGFLTGVTNGGTECEIQFLLEDGINVTEEPELNNVTEVKPILRPLSDMTQDEFIELFKLCSLFDLSECSFIGTNDKDGVWCNAEYEGRVIDAIRLVGDYVEMMNNDGTFSGMNPQSKAFKFFISKHFDLFGLIEAGLAIDKTKAP